MKQNIHWVLLWGIMGMLLLGSCSPSLSRAGEEAEKATGVVVSPEFKEPVSLPDPVNTGKWEDSPRISPDGNTLYFCRTPKVSLFRFFIPFMQKFDIYQATRTESGYEVKRLACSVPDEFSLDGAGYSRDGKTLYFNAVRKGTVGKTDIYVSEFKDGTWTRGTNMGRPINSEEHEAEPHITRDGLTLYFASTRPGGHGEEADIYVSRKVDGAWSEPVNLGPPINTELEEHQAFLSPDQETIYFTRDKSAKGHPGPAIFRSRKRANGTWEEPKEIISNFVGEPSVTDDGRFLYFVHAMLKFPPSQSDADILYAEIKDGQR